MRWLVVIAISAVLQLTGCASVQLERGKDLSSAGGAYARATMAVIDLAIDAAVDSSSEAQIRRGLTAATSAAERRAREKELQELDDALVGNVQSYLRLKRSVSSVEGYFLGLQALSGAKPGEAVEASMQSLADRVNGLNQALERSNKIDDNKKSAIARLAGLVVTQVHGAAVAGAMQRDAAVIGRALVLQELALKAAVGDVVRNMKDANDRFYRDNVRAPFVRGEVGGAWGTSRLKALKTRAIGSSPEAVGSAADAAQHMQAVWARILSGDTSSQELLTMLRDTNELLDAAVALKKTATND